MKWATCLCRAVAFLVASAPAILSRTVQPVTYAYTTSYDGEYSETYQDGVHHVYDINTQDPYSSTPYSLHPSVLAHHYYDPPSSSTSRFNILHTTSTTEANIPNTTRKPRKKNDYVAKVSYVRNPESVSFATTIGYAHSPSSTEPQMRKTLVRKRTRPLKPADTIPVEENSTEFYTSNYTRPFSSNYSTTVDHDLPAEVYSKMKQKMTGDGRRLVSISGRRYRPRNDIRTPMTVGNENQSRSNSTRELKPSNITTPTTTTEKIKVKTKPTATPLKLNQSKPKVKPDNQKTDTENLIQTTVRSVVHRNHTRPRKQESTTSEAPHTTTKTATNGYSAEGSNRSYDKEMVKYAAESSIFTTDQPPDESTPEEEEFEFDNDSHEDDTEYPDDDQEDGGAEEDEQPPPEDHTTDKTLQKPLKFAYTPDLKQSASDDHENQNQQQDQDNAGEKVKGEKHRAAKHQQSGNKADKAYQSHEVYDKAKKGHSDKKGHNVHHHEEGGKKKKHKEESGHYGAHHVSAEGDKAAEYKETGKHKKGHSTKGSHNVHKKNEYLKKHEFYDEHHEDDAHQKYGDFHKGQKHKKGGSYDVSHKDKDYSEGHKGKKGKHKKGYYVHEDRGHVKQAGQKGHHGHDHSFAKHGGDAEGKKWKYEKAREDGESDE